MIGTQYYFAYGKNLNTDALTSRIGKVKCIGKAVLFNHELKFNVADTKVHENSFANVVPKMNEAVHGVLWELTNDQMGKLDRFESWYQRQTLTVISTKTNKTYLAQVYIGNVIEENVSPSIGYITEIMNGAIKHDLPEEYLQSLKKKIRVAYTRCSSFFRPLKLSEANINRSDRRGP